jgi:hypothetical protein
MNEDLRQWFNPKHPKGGWKRIDSKGNVVGPCAREPGEPKPKCMSNEKRAMLSKRERAAAVRAKRKHDPDPERTGEPIMVSNFGKGKISEENEAVNKELWAKIQDLTAGRISSMEHNGETITGPNDGKGFDVHPSAYSNGWASKLYKRLGGTWRTKNESLQFSDFIQIDEVSPPDYKLTKFTHRPDIRADFRKRYGDDWQAVLYGKAWKNFKLKKKRGEVRKPSAKQKAKLVAMKAQDVVEDIYVSDSTPTPDDSRESIKKIRDKEKDIGGKMKMLGRKGKISKGEHLGKIHKDYDLHRHTVTNPAKGKAGDMGHEPEHDTHHYSVVHRKSGDVAGEIEAHGGDIDKKTGKHIKGRGDKAVQIKWAKAHPDHSAKKIGHSLHAAAYKHLHSRGHNIVSDTIQSPGGASIWKRLRKDPSTKGSMKFHGGKKPLAAHKVPDEKIWNTKDDADQTHLVLHAKKPKKTVTREATEAKPYKGYNPEKNHPEGGLKPSYAKKLGIHAGVETKRAAERAGGFGKLKGKVAKRRDSFCSRMCGMKRENTSAEVAADPKSKINASLRVWGCNC